MLFQIGCIIYFNLKDIRCSIDHDLANTFYHFSQIIEHHTFRLNKWFHTTSLEFDGSFFGAYLFYFFTRDLFLSVGLSNIVMMIIYISTILAVLKNFNVKNVWIFFSISLVLTPYSFGMLEYFNMMFYGGACYSIKALIPLLAVLLLQLSVKDDKKHNKLIYMMVMIFYVALLLLTTISTGVYAFIVGLLPIFITVGFDIWIDSGWKGKYNLRHLVVGVTSIIVTIVGQLAHSYLYNGTSRMNMKITKLENQAVNLRACFAGVFQLFGAFTSEDINAFSTKGIYYCVKILMVCTLLITCIYNFKACIKKSSIIDIRKMFSISFIYVFSMLVLVDCRYPGNFRIEYRYLLVGVIPLILLLGMQLSIQENTWTKLQRIVVKTICSIVLLILVMGNNISVNKHWDRTTYAVELCDYFNSIDIDSVFFVDDPDTSIICKGLDKNHKYGAYITESNSLYYGICSYIDSQYGWWYGNKNILAVIEGNNIEDVVPDDIALHYRKIGHIRWYDLYYSDNVYFQ